jgi:hypothetical protein
MVVSSNSHDNPQAGQSKIKRIKLQKSLNCWTTNAIWTPQQNNIKGMQSLTAATNNRKVNASFNDRDHLITQSI